MKLVSVTPARNESWVLGFSLRAALCWVDHAVVLVHSSTDGTLEIVREVARETGRVTILEEADSVWREMAHRQRLLEQARNEGATHVAIVDADEVLSANLWDWVRHQTQSLPPGSYLQIPLPQLWDSISEYAVDAPSHQGSYKTNWGHCQTTVAFADAPRLCWKATGGYEHHHREPHNARQGAGYRPVDGSGVMHLQFADRRRLVAKHAAYKMTERIRWPAKPIREINSMYNLAIKPDHVRKVAVPAEWMAGYGDIVQHLRLGEVPWQEEWCRSQIAIHGREKFVGLDLFGVVE